MRKVKEKVLKAVSQVYNVSEDKIKGPRRLKKIVEARKMVVFVLAWNYGDVLSHREIASLIKRERSYVTIVYRQMRDWAVIYPDVSVNYEKVMRKLEKQQIPYESQT